MIPALMLSVLAPSPQTITVDLYRGAKLSDGGYWAVADTFLDSKEADKAKGGLFTLEGGKGKTVLIKFGDLERAIPQFAKISKATLYLSPSSPDKPALTSIATLKAPWGEGPLFGVTLARGAEPAPVRWAANWRQRRSGSIDWQQSGATGPDDATPIAGATMDLVDKEIAIGGLAATIQNMRDRWYENNGFALNFSGDCEFFSSQAKTGKPRLVVEYTLDSAQAGPDLSVQYIDRTGSGEGTTYKAVVKNVGGAPAQAFDAQWTVGEKPGGRFAVGKALAPGEETTIDFQKPYRANNTDHRVQKVMLRLYPTSPEPNSNNDAVEIFEDGLILSAGVSDPKAENLDSRQAALRSLHEGYYEQSRFSFAPDGVIERLRLVPNDAEAILSISAATDQEKKDVKSLARQTSKGLTGLAPVAPPQQLTFEGRQIFFDDPYAGINGFGDTRYEGLIPSGIPMLYVPVSSPLFDNLPMEATDLLSGTEVSAINLAIGRKGKAREGILWDLPATIILRATDMTGKPLDGAELAFYQVSDGQMPEAPTQTILTKDGGTVILENRDIPSGILDKDALHQLKRNPFGNLTTDGKNGTILIRAHINGETEWGWLKAWQLVDAYHRGNKAAAIIDVRFNAPSASLDRSANLAKGKLATDKLGGLPAKLASLVDDNPDTEVALGDKPGDWIEIDLGRDRPIGEVQLVLKDGTMPSRFDIQAYATGQTAPDTDAWVKDLNFAWTKPNRSRQEGSGIAIPYRGPMTRSRFIRIVNRSGGAGRIAEIRIFALKSE